MAKNKNLTEEKILDVDASMQGTITFKDPVNLRINGTFEGKLDTRGQLTIGENAKVRANIHGDNIVIAGKVVGNVTATQSLSVVAPASIEGDIVAPRFSVGEGSFIEGKVTMKNAGASGQDVFLTLRDVAQYLDLESRVVEDLVKNNQIPVRQENGNMVFSKSAVDGWLQNQKA
jgi:cytoskeletal protein CcmA (bactofilin family)